MASTGLGADDGHVTASRMDFHHPYTPYDIQETFMRTVYQVLEDGKVGILESPTGTVGGSFKIAMHVTRLSTSAHFTRPRIHDAASILVFGANILTGRGNLLA